MIVVRIDLFLFICHNFLRSRVTHVLFMFPFYRYSIENSSGQFSLMEVHKLQPPAASNDRLLRKIFTSPDKQFSRQTLDFNTHCTQKPEIQFILPDFGPSDHLQGSVALYGGLWPSLCLILLMPDFMFTTWTQWLQEHGSNDRRASW